MGIASARESLKVASRGLHASNRLYWDQYWNDKYDPSEPTFEKVLVANRGEIACRVIKTCKRLGIQSVAVYSEADALAPHVQLADEAVCIGPAPASESYLVIDNILRAVIETGADAVHPGYGFLSENMQFAAKLDDIGVKFVGPSSEAISAMGDKIESKRIAADAKVNTIPGFDGEVQDVEEAVKIAGEIGYPVMIKASAGGGGKGMRIAWNEKEAREGFRLSKEEAKSSFGDDRMLIEKFVDQPRHIEFQILGDNHGNVIYLHERECSIQRRNQKVIEEAPSVYLDPETRAKMGDQAVALAKAVGYSTAGTVEFLVDKDKNFYFLEMNTRLQVEHPITELVTGIDIVHHMLRIAKGHTLSHKQEDVPIKGWAIESRVYAEDPYKEFGLPSIGTLRRYREPLEIPHVRCDSGVQEGSEISIFYDPMICKLICYGDTRQAAIDTTACALDSYVIRGVTHNIPLLRDIVTEDRFVRGDLTTNYLPEVYPDGFKGKQLTSEARHTLLASAAAVYVTANSAARHFTNQHRLPVTEDQQKQWFLSLMLGGEEHSIQVTKVDNNKLLVNEGEARSSVVDCSALNLSAPLLQLQVDGSDVTLQLLSHGASGTQQLSYHGTTFELNVMEERTRNLWRHMKVRPKLDVSKIITAPMPGVLNSIGVAVGDMIAAGMEVGVLEAMKMQNSLKVLADGKVKAVHFKAGDLVNEGDVLVELE